MSTQHVEARAGAYADSVTLMAVSARAQAVPGVRAALVAMATELNLHLLDGLGMSPPATAGPGDLLIGIRADDDEAVAAALAVVGEALAARAPDSARSPGEPAGQPPRTTSGAARRHGPGLALISVPGQHAFAEAADALDAGCDVMIFSDNVPLEQEIALKDLAAGRDLLVMGPDCGTALVAGIGLGFANSVSAGPVGLVAASGTGAQHLACLLDAAGAGVSAILGVGGRDLSAAVGGRSARAALRALDADAATTLIVVVSKPPDESVAASLREFATTLATPVQFALTGPGQADLTEAAQQALTALGYPVPDWPRWVPGAAADSAGPVPGTAGAAGAAGAPGDGAGTCLRGLFAGGTLCDEAMAIAVPRLGAVYSNVPFRPGWHLDAGDPAAPGPRHVMIDFGDDQLTAGRPHPMIDQRLRLERLAAAAADPDTAVILLDVVLGHGAHPDPAAELAPAVAAARAGRGVPVVVSLIGTGSDPQDLRRQAGALSSAGAWVFASNAAAARFACDLAAAARPPAAPGPGVAAGADAAPGPACPGAGA